MRPARLVDLLARGAVAVILLTLVVAAFAMTPNSTRTSSGVSVMVGARAAPASRHLLREPEVAVATAPVSMGDPIDDMRAVPEEPAAPEPVVIAEPEPAPRAAPVVVAEPLVTDDTRAAELEMLRLMNVSRVAGGLAALVMDVAVSTTARDHSDVESHYGYVYHDGPDGTARARDATACATGWYGENTGKVWNGNLRALHIEFMSEPWEPINHRTNIMDPAFRRVGIGAVQGRDALYLTMVFCR